MDRNMNNGRDKLPWKADTWARIDEAVHEECSRTKIARKFLPIYGPIDPGATTVPSDTVVVEGGRLAIDEAATTPLIELFVEISLTGAQLEKEEELMTAVTLATRAANLLSQAEDVVIFQGQSAIDGNGGPRHPLFAGNRVRARSGPAGRGLLNAADVNLQLVTVPPLDPNQTPPRWGENTTEAISTAYSLLQSGRGLSQAHYGHYAAVLHHEPYADTYAPLQNTLIMPADRIKPLVEEGFYGTGTLPELTGLFVSLGGNSMDLVVGVDTTTAFLQEDDQGLFRFRVLERFALRVKERSAVIRLQFATS